MAAPNIDVAVIHANGAGISSKNFTKSGFGTVVAAIVFCVRTTQADEVFDDATDAAFSFGVITGSTQRCFGIRVEDNVAAVDSGRSMRDDGVLIMPNEDGTADWRGDGSIITDGINIDFGVNDASDYEITVILLGGTDLSAAVGTVTPSTTLNAGVTVSGLGFTPHLVLFGGNGGDHGSSVINQAIYSIGAAHNGSGGITQRCLMGYLSSEGNASGNPGARLSTTRIGAQYFTSQTTWDAEFTAAASGEFTITTRNGGTSGDELFYLALSSSNDQDDFELGSVSAQSASGEQTFGSAFQPQAIFGVLSALQAEDTDVNNDGQAEMLGMFASDGSGGQTRCHLTLCDQGAATITCAGFASQKLMSINHISSGVGAHLKEGDFHAFETSGGTTIDWDDTSSFNWKGFFINIKGADLAGGGTNYDESVTFTVDAGSTLARVAGLAETATFSIDAGSTLARSVDLVETTTFSVQSGSTLAQVAAMGEAVSVAISSSFVVVDEQGYGASIAEGITFMASDSPHLAAVESITSAISTSYSFSAPTSINVIYNRRIFHRLKSRRGITRQPPDYHNG
jgi:hypothetical protein